MGTAAVTKLPAIQMEQAGTTLYATSLKAGDLVSGMTQVDAWSPTNKSGYQRMPLEARFRKIARYVEGKEGKRAILPQAVVLNYRNGSSKLKFKAIDEGPMGYLEVASDQCLWQVD